MRRTALAEGLGFVINSYLQTRSLLNPTGMAANALDQYGQQLELSEKESLSRQEAEMRAMVGEIQNLRATFDNGRLVVHMDKAMVLELVENYLRKMLARQEAGATATFKVDLGAAAEADHDAELVFPRRSIFLKFVPEGALVAQLAVSYLERARKANPSEYWLLTPDPQEIDFPFEPIFSENRIERGRLRTYTLSSLLSGLVGKEYDVVSTHEAGGGFKFVISKKPQAPTQVDTQQ